MSLYENEGKRTRVSVNLTTSQRHKLESVSMLYGRTFQTILSDCVDSLYQDYLDMVSGRANFNDMMRMSMAKLTDDYIKLKEIKGLVPHTSSFRPHHYGQQVPPKYPEEDRPHI